MQVLTQVYSQYTTDIPHNVSLLLVSGSEFVFRFYFQYFLFQLNIFLAITAQLRALADQQRSTAKDAAKIAAEQVAAKLNQSIGSMAGSVPVVGQHAGLGMVVSEEWSIPNRVVGLGMCL